ncbi:hypothetical protein [Mycolicibacterium poriferae]|uniref:hypothetical protein n=1 Tax=Mycolicibacterium poriferae TaxID=39694 RepID=UPI0032197C1F
MQIVPSHGTIEPSPLGLGIIDTLVVGVMSGAGMPGVDCGVEPLGLEVVAPAGGVVAGSSDDPELHPTTTTVAVIAANPAVNSLVVCMGRHANKGGRSAPHGLVAQRCSTAESCARV